MKCYKLTLDDYQLAMLLEPTLWASHLAVYGLVKRTETNPHASIVDALGNSFSTTDFKDEYQRQRGVLPDNRSITRYLKSLINDEVIVRVQKGQFMKK